MLPFTCMSLRCKLMSIILGVSGLVLLLTSGAFIANEGVSYRRTVMEEMAAQADMIGNSAAPALLFSDQPSAMAILATAKANRRILAIFLISSDHDVFASYVASKAEESSLGKGSTTARSSIDAAGLLREVRRDADHFWNWSGRYSLARDIILDGTVIGKVVIQTDLHPLVSKLIPFLFLVLMVMGTMSALAYLLANKLQGFISTPVLELAGTMKQVSRDKDFSLRARKTTGAEIGLLIDGFNEMLAEIQARDEKLAQRQQALLEQQEKLEELNRALESGISKAVADVRQKDQLLIQQSRQAAMGEMLNNIAHQWRQPLNMVGLLVQNLLLDWETGRFTERELRLAVERAMGTIGFMSRTIDDFRNFFKGDKQQEIFYLDELVTKTLRFLSSSVTKNGIEIVTRMERTEAVGFPNEYSQVLLNILNNATDVLLERKVSSPGITIRVFQDGGCAVVAITDNGGGIESRTLDRIFEPYFSTKEAGKGTGIGLYMSKVIIEQNMNGLLSARNVGGGAEFRIESPLPVHLHEKDSARSLPEHLPLGTCKEGLL